MEPRLAGETLWFRVLAGGGAPRYLRLRPRAKLSAILESASDATLPNDGVEKVVIEILNLRPAMSYRV
jgi:hypothetical protein